MTDIKRVGDSGVHNVEGNVAGGRAARLTKEREAQRAAYEDTKNKIKHENSAPVARIDSKFNAARFNSLTSSLMTLTSADLIAYAHSATRLSRNSSGVR